MSKSILGSSFEYSLRILLLLNEIRNLLLDEQQIGAIDYISIYAADFGLMDENLHGYGTYRFGEYYARKDKINSAMKELALDGYVQLHPTPTGYRYSITNEGKTFCDRLDSNYTQEYLLAVRSVAKKYDITNVNSMVNEINRLTVESMKEGGHE